MSTCPECGSKDYYETARIEHFDSCGYDVYYGDAHATGDAQITKINGVPVTFESDQKSDDN